MLATAAHRSALISYGPSKRTLFATHGHFACNDKCHVQKHNVTLCITSTCITSIAFGVTPSAACADRGATAQVQQGPHQVQLKQDMAGDLAGKTALITGATSGIGRYEERSINPLASLRLTSSSCEPVLAQRDSLRVSQVWRNRGARLPQYRWCS